MPQKTQKETSLQKMQAKAEGFITEIKHERLESQKEAQLVAFMLGKFREELGMEIRKIVMTEDGQKVGEQFIVNKIKKNGDAT